jgi:hypothetical protein
MQGRWSIQFTSFCMISIHDKQQCLIPKTGNNAYDIFLSFCVALKKNTVKIAVCLHRWWHIFSAITYNIIFLIWSYSFWTLNTALLYN